ncbi:hypothetical protein [Actinoallomurus acaciae]|uniref:DNA-binding protein n=1 Tax=Actinoallomurus acaciae TaxID=502577 RepID=A0ABV5YUG5_9ACTN
MLPIDPGADIGRRAWIPCPRCRDHEGCDTCGTGRTCTAHWRYLLANRGRVLYLQCPSCTHLWEHETPAGGDAA